MTQFRINSFIVDIDRCQITDNGLIQQLEPKVIDVLHYLARHPKQVISQEVLFEALWPGTTYNPSSIQRCIAILRKALNENAKNAQIIITHAKRGYSLEADISSIETTHILSHKLILTLVSLTAFLIFFYITFITTEHKIDYSLSQLSPVTSYSLNEFSASYSPDNQYLVFIRQQAKNQHHIWLKNLATNNLIKLTKTARNFQSVNWQATSSSLVFVINEANGTQIGNILIEANTGQFNLKNDLLTLDEQKIRGKVTANNEGELFFIAENKDHTTQLMHYIPGTGQLQTILSYNKKPQLQLVEISHNKQTLALVVSLGQNKHEIALFDLKTSQLQSLATLAKGIHSISWHPDDQNLLFSSKNKLFLLSLNSQIQDINFNNYHYISGANYNDQGDQILMTLNSIDIDIIQVQENATQSIINSRGYDIQPTFSPDGKRFLFQSNRSGAADLFLHENNNNIVLFKNEKDLELFGFTWSPDGKSVAIATKSDIYIIDVRSTEIINKISLNEPVYIRDWFNKSNALLVNIGSGSGKNPAKLNLATLKFIPLSELSGSCALLDNNDNLYLNHQSQLTRITTEGKIETFWQSPGGNIEIFTINKDNLMIELSTPEQNEYWLTDFQGQSKKMNHLEGIANMNLVDTSDNNTNLLFHSEVKINQTLVQLN